jgi:hypothetical protein
VLQGVEGGVPPRTSGGSVDGSSGRFRQRTEAVEIADWVIVVRVGPVVGRIVRRGARSDGSGWLSHHRGWCSIVRLGPCSGAASGGSPDSSVAMRAATCGEGDGGDEGAVGSGNVRRQVCEAKCEREEEKQAWAVF